MCKSQEEVPFSSCCVEKQTVQKHFKKLKIRGWLSGNAIQAPNIIFFFFWTLIGGRFVNIEFR